MATITNNAAGPRGFSAVGNALSGGHPREIILQPGETIEAELHDPHHPVYRAMQDRGEVDFGGALTEGADTNKSTITNNSDAPRGVNVKSYADTHHHIELAPGQSVEAEVFDPHNPVYRAMQDAGEVDFGGGLT